MVKPLHKDHHHRWPDVLPLRGARDQYLLFEVVYGYSLTAQAEETQDDRLNSGPEDVDSNLAPQTTPGSPANSHTSGGVERTSRTPRSTPIDDIRNKRREVLSDKIAKIQRLMSHARQAADPDSEMVNSEHLSPPPANQLAGIPVLNEGRKASAPDTPLTAKAKRMGDSKSGGHKENLPPLTGSSPRQVAHLLDPSPPPAHSNAAKLFDGIDRDPPSQRSDSQATTTKWDTVAEGHSEHAEVQNGNGKEVIKYADGHGHHGGSSAYRHHPHARSRSPSRPLSPSMSRHAGPPSPSRSRNSCPPSVPRSHYLSPRHRSRSCSRSRSRSYSAMLQDHDDGSSEDDDATPAPPDNVQATQSRRRLWVCFRGGKDLNPLSKKTRMGPTPELPGLHAVYHTDAVFERIPLSKADLLANVHPHQVAFCEDNEDDVIIIVPAAPSQKHADKHPTFVPDVINTIQSFGFGDRDLKLVRLRPAAPVGRSRTAPPLGWMLINASLRTRAYLDWQGTIATSKSIAFSAYTLKSEQPSWVMAAVGNVPDDDPEAMHHCLLKAAKELSQDRNFQAVAHRHQARRGVPGDAAHHAWVSLLTMSILHVRRRDPQTGLLRPIWLIMCEPIGADNDDHREWCAFFKTHSYATLHEPLPTISVKIHCEFCLAVTHAHYDCPMANTVNWLGPRAETGEEYSLRIKASNKPTKKEADKVSGKRDKSFVAVRRGGKHK
ncbi:hypothetical protein D9619_009739 [Psilocybe cf. subviscida]|uniref:Uncharacterized protein n=1 Tax=Psilocybe cf. subviscida TaxID=2480587 RepID=A0A8H5F667_9AGAR|nr:hypothetical protein D9619_009739 [Psilocybe cf. subviscida]